MICVINQKGDAIMEELGPENESAVVILLQVDSADHVLSVMVLDH